MTTNFNPAIVIVAYKRPYALERLLNSLQFIKNKAPITLVISIDGGDEINTNVIEVAENFNWPGTKKVVKNKMRLGLKAHVLKCGDLTKEYGSIIMLEEDLIVAPSMYEYAKKALEYYYEEDKIAGISLYNYQYNEAARLPFIPLQNDKTTYFIQMPCSWGQCWTKNQWFRFKEWYHSHQTWEDLSNLPSVINNWPDKSWKKYFTKYMVERDKYFVYPYISFTSNSGEEGENCFNTNILKSVMTIKKESLSFCSFTDTEKISYDVFFELDQNIFKNYNDLLSNYEIEVDLYNSKNILNSDKKFVLTTKDVSEKLASFGSNLEPIELNVLFNVKGNDVKLAYKKNIIQGSNPYLNLLKYFNKLPEWSFSILSPSILRQIIFRLENTGRLKNTGRFIAKLLRKYYLKNKK